MKIIWTVLYMYGIAAVISFFVAFLIKTIFVVIDLFMNKKILSLRKINTHEAGVVQKGARRQTNKGEVNAAIAMALHLYLKEMNEYENLKITIQKTVKPYSPWSSKIYGVSQWRR